MSKSIPSQIVSRSKSNGESVISFESEPHEFSYSSWNPSLSSSKSASRPPGPSGSISGYMSPSVSTGRVGSIGNGSGPLQITFPLESVTVLAPPSQKPSPSVSGFDGSVPSDASSTSDSPSLSSSVSSTRVPRTGS